MQIVLYLRIYMINLQQFAAVNRFNNNMRYILQVLFPLTFMSLLFVGCNDLDEIELGGFTAEYAIPLFTSDLSLEDLISNRADNTTLLVAEDGQLTLNYKGAVLDHSAKDIFDFTAQLLPIEITDTFFVITNEDFDIPGSIDIDFLNVKAGQLTMLWSSDIPQDLTLDVSIPQFVKDGKPYTRSFFSPYEGELPIEGNWVGESLAGFQIQGGDTLISVQYDAFLPDGSKFVLPSFLMILTNIEYSYAEGFLGNDIYDLGRDTIEIDFFDNWDQGIVNFEDPIIKLNVFNSFGFPVDANFLGLDVVGIDGERLSLQSESIDEGVAVNFPNFNQIGETLITEFLFDKDNSNIIEILSVGPAAVEYELDGEPNAGLAPASRGFMTDTSSLEIQLEVELPLNGYTFGFALRDTIDLDFTDFENVTAAEFKLITENAIPLGLQLDVSFVDANFETLDVLSIKDENLFIGAAPVDENGFVNGINTKEIIETFDAERFARIKSAKNILIKTSFSTTNSSIPQLVKFSANQSVKSRMGLKVEVAN